MSKKLLYQKMPNDPTITRNENYVNYRFYRDNYSQIFGVPQSNHSTFKKNAEFELKIKLIIVFPIFVKMT